MTLTLTSKQKNIIILILGSLAAIGPFSIDMYLPGFPAIAKDLNTDISHVGYSLTSFFIGISLGQLLYGPLVDRFGRTKPIKIGLSIYCLAAIGCAFAPSINWLIGMRFLLAIGGCAGMVASRAIVRDIFPLHEIAKVFSMLMLVMGVAPIIAPTMGGFVTANYGWRAIFFFLAFFSSLMLFMIYRFLPESRGADPSISLLPKAILADFANVIKEPAFISFGLAGGFSMAAMFAYISGSPFVFMEMFGLSDIQYGWAFGMNAFGFIAGSQLNRFFLRKNHSLQITRVTSTLLFIVAILLLAGTLFFRLNAAGTLALIFSYMFFLGLTAPNMTAMALAPFAKFAGSASALIGSVQMITGALASALIGYLHNGTAIPMAAIMAVCGTFGFIFFMSFNFLSKRKGLVSEVS